MQLLFLVREENRASRWKNFLEAVSIENHQLKSHMGSSSETTPDHIANAEKLNLVSVHEN